MNEHATEKDAFCLPCWNEAREWVDRDGGVQVLRYDRLHARHLSVTSPEAAQS